ncbi:MAG: PQQ-binding-like beta-propeller repeat protein [Pseudomonadota bacterium]
MRASLLSAVLAVVLPDAAMAVTFNPTQRLAGPAFSADDRFGSTVAASGDLIAVGAPNDATNGVAAGQAFVYDANTGDLVTVLEDPNASAANSFGRSVAIDGNRVLVGAAGSLATEGTLNGRAYLYDSTTGALLRTFVRPATDTGRSFGEVLAIDGDVVLISDGQQEVFLFNAATGALEQRFRNPDQGRRGLSFGNDVAVDGDLVLIGAAGDSSGGNNAGQAFLYSASTGELLRTLDDPTPADFDQFGIAVDLSGDNVLIGAAGATTNRDNAGEAFLFSAETGDLLHTLTDDLDPASGSEGFGNALAISGDTIVIGGPVREDLLLGQAFLFDAETGELQQRFVDPEPQPGERFAASIGLSGNTLAFGVPGEDFPDPFLPIRTEDAGGVVVYQRDAPATADVPLPGGLGLYLGAFIVATALRRARAGRSCGTSASAT